LEVETDGGVVPILVPSEFGRMNLQKGNRFRFKVEVREKGILEAVDVTQG
jgi:hypothetical protein